MSSPQPTTIPLPTRSEVGLVPLSVEQLDLLASYDLAGASRSVGLTVTPWFLDGQWIWARMAGLARAEPEHAWWRTQYLAIAHDAATPRIVGHFRFHYLSDETYYPTASTGEVHIGWSIDPLERGRGYAQAGTRALIGLLPDDSAIHTVVALINYRNLASIGVAQAVGFHADGQQQHRFGWTMGRFVYSIDR